MAAKILVGGIGNVLLNDDGVGPFVVRTMLARYRFSPDVDVEDLGTPGMELTDMLSKREAIILVDSVRNAKEPGAVTVYREQEIRKACAAVRTSPHEPPLRDALMMLELLGTCPQSIQLIGIAGASYEMNCTMTATVRQAAEIAIGEVLGALQRLNAPCTPLEKSGKPEIWWTPLETSQQIAL